MKKTIFSTILFLIFILFISVTYLSFFGLETKRFNQMIKNEIKKNNKDIKLNFEKISVLLDIKNLTLFIKFIEPKIYYENVGIPLNYLRTDVSFASIINKSISIKKIQLSSNEFKFKTIKPILKKIELNDENLKIIKKANFQIKNLELELDQNLKFKKNYIISGKIKDAYLKISKKYELIKLNTNFMFKENYLNFSNSSWVLKAKENTKNDFFNGEIDIKKINKDYGINFNLETRDITNLFNISAMNFSFLPGRIVNIKSNFIFKKNKEIYFSDISIVDDLNKFVISDLILDKKFLLKNFKSIEIKTKTGKEINNDFKIINKKKQILIRGKVFDAKNIIKEISNKNKNNNILEIFTKDIEIDLKRIIKGAKFPIKNFRMIGYLKNGSFEKVSAKSDFSLNEHMDISLKKNKNNSKTLEIYSDIATPLLIDYDFFEGLESGNLHFLSTFDKKESNNVLTINNFKLNNAPALAKLLTLADLKGLTDTLKGEGISFETLSIKYKSDKSTMQIDEIFMIGPSISVLIDGYVEKKSGLISLRGTMVPAKTLNSLISKIPVVGEILVGKKIGEGIFGLSFKIKGLQNNLKTTVNPIKTLAPRFITRAIEAAKKRKSKQQ